MSPMLRVPEPRAAVTSPHCEVSHSQGDFLHVDSSLEQEGWREERKGREEDERRVIQGERRRKETTRGTEGRREGRRRREGGKEGDLFFLLTSQVGFCAYTIESVLTKVVPDLPQSNGEAQQPATYTMLER